MANRQNKRAIQHLRGAARQRVEHEDYKRHLSNEGYGAGTNTQKGRKERKGVVCPTRTNSQTSYSVSSDTNVTRIYITGGGHDSFIDHHTEIMDKNAEEWKAYDEEKLNKFAAIANDTLPFLNSDSGRAVAAGTDGAQVSLDVFASSYEGFRGDPSHGVHNNLRIQGTQGGMVTSVTSGTGNQKQKTGKDAFNDGGETPMLYPSRPAPEPINTKAKNYDESTDLPNKPQHAQKFATEMHPDFIPYAKAVLFDLWDKLKASVELNSTLRTCAKQKEMYDYVKAWQKANPDKRNSAGRHLPPGYGGEPARPGHSKHNLGVAIDFNPTIGNKKYTSGDGKSVWEKAGIPKIIKDLGLRWGGDFRRNYDPIHMDLAVDESVRSSIVAATEHIKEIPKVIAAMSKIPIRKGSDNTGSDNQVPI